mmetsp:Transcript_27957/g.43434  ORF Transcript_27957/g.43434 Transcript_27957/m.43434 type:complete len:309 (-) Transcript_27957:95-1021(-)|eukprot:CAMPEP_0196816528 /NCGR_PEP_ID=MMETSP1362-20130617/55854_1 /TAXON_ID=163516 /ORGANISM="Leptocylindrus danicus, Strain CCMP1856" /LENGTH=308 /DNA_ID=CAMNT_0042193907 /DNA_START=142 /DNA_END=1068 /DNA_ORIENTATION=-
MRFLLNLPSKLVHKNPPSARRILAATAAPRSTGSNNTSSTMEESTKHNNVEAQAWSQQCGAPTCGCMLRLQVDMTSDGTIQSAEYHSKALVLAAEPNGTTSRRELAQDGTWHNVIDTHYRFVPALTTKGRPMVQQCRCKPLKQLANAVCERLPGQNMVQLRNSLEFAGTRSSASFRQHLLNVFLPHKTKLGRGARQHQAGRCFDLVEEVFMALVKGYMPRARERYNPQYEEAVSAHHYDYYHHDNDYYHGVEDGNRRRINRGSSSTIAVASNDGSMSKRKQQDKFSGEGLDGAYFDWVSFVDDQKDSA